MTKGQQQMLNNEAGTNSIHGLRGFLYIPQMVPHSSHVIFNFNYSYFYVRGECERGIWTDFRLMFSALGLKCASSLALPNGDICLQSFVTASSFLSLVSEMAMFSWLVQMTDRKFAEQFKSSMKKM